MSQRKEENVPGMLIHPLITFLINGMSEIRNLMNSNPIACVRYTRNFCIFLDPEVKEKLSKQILQLDSWEISPRCTRNELIAIINQIINELYHAGYFLGAKVRTIEVGGDRK